MFSFCFLLFFFISLFRAGRGGVKKGQKGGGGGGGSKNACKKTLFFGYHKAGDVKKVLVSPVWSKKVIFSPPRGLFHPPGGSFLRIFPKNPVPL
jgi:hypothetical protein